MEQVRLKDFGETLKNVGIALGGLLVMAALFGLTMLFIVGATAISLWVREWIPVVFWSSLLIVFLILGPLSLIPPARFIAAIGFVIASFVFGAMMWCCGLGVTYEASTWSSSAAAPINTGHISHWIRLAPVG